MYIKVSSILGYPLGTPLGSLSLYIYLSLSLSLSLLATEPLLPPGGSDSGDWAALAALGLPDRPAAGWGRRKVWGGGRGWLRGGPGRGWPRRLRRAAEPPGTGPAVLAPQLGRPARPGASGPGDSGPWPRLGQALLARVDSCSGVSEHCGAARVLRREQADVRPRPDWLHRYDDRLRCSGVMHGPIHAERLQI